MTVNVELPRMGESVTEGTIVRWLKQEGDRVEIDEPLVEISTDKIDTELPSPAAGILKQIVVGEDQTVQVGAQLAVIDDGAANGEAPKPAPKKKEQARVEPDEGTTVPSPPEQEPDTTPSQEPDQEPSTAPDETPPTEPDETPTPKPPSQEPEHATATSPLVRKLAREKGVALAALQGTGDAGRITKQDVLDAASGKTPTAASPKKTPAVEGIAVPTSQTAGTETQDFTRIRKAIAEHMVRSNLTAAHVTDVVEVDMTAVAHLRDRMKTSFAETEGIKLTFLPFIAVATVEALRAFPEFNAHLSETTATLIREVNLGIAVGRDEGLIVPVVHGAGEMNLVGLARAIADVGTRARAKGGLKPDDVSGGTFTISNGGSFGSLIFTPIINQPQVAVLGIGTIAKRPAVVTVDGNDAIGIRSMMYLCLSYDHRWIDGHKATQFNNHLKQLLEAAAFAAEFGLEP